MTDHSTAGPAARRSLILVFMLVGGLALMASGIPTAAAGPAQEEYTLQIPDPRGGGSSSGSNGVSSNPGGTGSGGSGSGPTVTLGGTSYPASGGGLGFGGSGGGDPFSSSATGDGSDSDEALLAKARRGVPTSSGLLATTTSTLGKTPAGLALIAAVLLIALAGLLALRRSRRATLS